MYTNSSLQQTLENYSKPYLRDASNIGKLLPVKPALQVWSLIFCAVPSSAFNYNSKSTKNAVRKNLAFTSSNMNKMVK